VTVVGATVTTFAATIRSRAGGSGASCAQRAWSAPCTMSAASAKRPTVTDSRNTPIRLLRRNLIGQVPRPVEGQADI
jgi:hypothetical protein